MLIALCYIIFKRKLKRKVIQMGKSRKAKHYLDDENYSIYKGIRKQPVKPTQAFKNRKDKRKKKFDWNDEIDE